MVNVQMVALFPFYLSSLISKRKKLVGQPASDSSHFLSPVSNKEEKLLIENRRCSGAKPKACLREGCVLFYVGEMSLSLRSRRPGGFFEGDD